MYNPENFAERCMRVLDNHPKIGLLGFLAALGLTTQCLEYHLTRPDGKVLAVASIERERLTELARGATYTESDAGITIRRVGIGKGSRYLVTTTEAPKPTTDQDWAYLIKKVLSDRDGCELNLAGIRTLPYGTVFETVCNPQ